ncbi:MAG TPA: acyltransferase [Longimicrobiales bacterium]|nr:acyltransferase [Longimicrobiales bacterium]
MPWLNDTIARLGRLVYPLVIHDRSRLGTAVRRRAYGTKCHVDTAVVITVAAHFEADEGCALYHGTYILNTAGRFVMGRRSHLGAFCYVNVAHGAVVLGHDVAVGPGTKIVAHSNHYRRGAAVTAERITADVEIGNNVFIGANCVILPGTKIPDNVVIGAGSVVRGELDADCIYAGAPARKIRQGWHG